MLMRENEGEQKGRSNVHTVHRIPTLTQIVAEERGLWGWFFVAFGSVFFLGFFYAAIISKLFSPSNNVIIAAIQNDRYYCFVVPLTLPILVVGVYFHWLSMKLFKHA